MPTLRSIIKKAIAKKIGHGIRRKRTTRKTKRGRGAFLPTSNFLSL